MWEQAGEAPAVLRALLRAVGVLVACGRLPDPALTSLATLEADKGKSEGGGLLKAGEAGGGGMEEGRTERQGERVTGPTRCWTRVLPPATSVGRLAASLSAEYCSGFLRITEQSPPTCSPAEFHPWLVFQPWT